MATSSNIASGRPSLPIRYTPHGCGPSTNQMPSFSYEGYMFVPSERHSREERWTSAEPTRLAFSQGDLVNEVIKQQRSGKTALEEFCEPRVDVAKRGMITKLIRERTTTESGSTYTLAAIKINRAYVNNEEPDFGKMSLRENESKDKESKNRRKETISVLVVLQGSVIQCSDPIPAEFSQTCNPNSANTIERLSPAAENLVSWTAPCTPTSSTPLRYLPFSYHNIDTYANGSDQSSTPQQVYQRSDDSRARSERSSSVTSFDTTSSSSPLTPTSATSNNDCFIAADHARNHNDPPVPPCPSAYALSGILMSTEPTVEKVLDENAQKQEPLRMQHSPTKASESARPYTAISSSAQTIISFTDPWEDGRHETLNVLKCSTGEICRPSAANHGPKSESMSSLPTSEDRTISTGDVMHDDDSPLHPQAPRAKSPDILERKPSWMDNMVPVIPPPAEMEPIETVLEDINAEYSVTEDFFPKRSNEKDTEHQNATKRYQPGHQENSYQHSICDESLTALPMPAREDIRASAYNTEAKGRNPLRPQHTGKTEYTESLSEMSAKRPANEARYLPPRTPGRLQSYEKLRPTDHTFGDSHQPIDRQERYDDVRCGATDQGKSHVSIPYPGSPLGRSPSYERLRPEHPPTTSISQPAGIRKLYKVKTYDEPVKAPHKHVKFSKQLDYSSSPDVPTGNDSPDTRPSSPRTTIASDPTETSRKTSQATSRPPLYRSYSPSPDVPTRNDTLHRDTRSSSPRTSIASDPTETSRTTSQATSRPPLYRSYSPSPDVPTRNDTLHRDTRSSSPRTSIASDPTETPRTTSQATSRRPFYRPYSSSPDVLTGNDILRRDTRPSSPRTTIASDPTEIPRATSQATSRPPLYRQSNYIPVHCSDTRGSYHSSPKNTSSKQSTKSTSREVKSSDRKRDKKSDSYNSFKAENHSESEPKSNKGPWACNRKSCDRYLQRPFATYEEAERHVRKAHKYDKTGSE